MCVDDEDVIALMKQRGVKLPLPTKKKAGLKGGLPPPAPSMLQRNYVEENTQEHMEHERRIVDEERDKKLKTKREAFMQVLGHRQVSKRATTAPNPTATLPLLVGLTSPEVAPSSTSWQAGKWQWQANASPRPCCVWVRREEAALPVSAHAAVLRQSILSLGSKRALIHLQSAEFRQTRGSTARAFRTLQVRSREIKLIVARCRESPLFGVALASQHAGARERGERERHRKNERKKERKNEREPYSRYGAGRRKVILKKVKAARHEKELHLVGFDLR